MRFKKEESPKPVQGVVAVTDNSGSLTVDGSVSVSNLPASYPVTDGGGSLTVDGSVSVSNLPAAYPVTDNGGTLTVDGTVAVTDGGGALTVDGSVSVSNLPATYPVTDNAGSLTVDGTVSSNQGTAAAQTSAGAWPVRLVGGTGDRAAGIDSATNTLQTIEYEHHEIHGGSAFSTYDVVDVTGQGTNRDYLIVTPDTTKWPHLRYEFTTEAEFTITLYEGTTTSNNGTTWQAYNRDRNSATAPTTLTFYAPTVTVAGTAIRTSKTGSTTQSGGGGSATHEWILKQNTKYLFRFTKVATGTHYISVKLWWYEHTNKTA